MMTFDSPGAFADHLQRILDALPTAERAGLEAGAEELHREAQARAMEIDPTGVLAAHVEFSVSGSVACVGVADAVVTDPATGLPVDVGALAEAAEFGVPGQPPTPFLAPAGFVRGEAAAAAIGQVVSRALAGELAPVRAQPSVGAEPPRKRRGLLA